MKKVLHVPDLKAHLIYVKKLVLDNEWRFTIDSCLLTDKVLKKKIGFIKRARGLLLLEDQADLCFTSVHQTTTSRVKIYPAHRRMGHPSFVLMKDYFPSMFCDIDVNTLSCEACQLAKHKLSPSKALNIRCLHSFDCVHSDVWAPCSIPSIGGNKWFILFVGDCSRFSWLYLTTSKADIPALIIQFYKMIHT